MVKVSYGESVMWRKCHKGNVTYWEGIILGKCLVGKLLNGETYGECHRRKLSYAETVNWRTCHMRKVSYGESVM